MKFIFYLCNGMFKYVVLFLFIQSEPLTNLIIMILVIRGIIIDECMVVKGTIQKLNAG